MCACLLQNLEAFLGVLTIPNDNDISVTQWLQCRMSHNFFIYPRDVKTLNRIGLPKLTRYKTSRRYPGVLTVVMWVFSKCGSNSTARAPCRPHPDQQDDLDGWCCRQCRRRPQIKLVRTNIYSLIWSMLWHPSIASADAADNTTKLEAEGDYSKFAKKKKEYFHGVAIACTEKYLSRETTFTDEGGWLTMTTNV